MILIFNTRERNGIAIHRSAYNTDYDDEEPAVTFHVFCLACHRHEMLRWALRHNVLLVVPRCITNRRKNSHVSSYSCLHWNEEVMLVHDVHIVTINWIRWNRHLLRANLKCGKCRVRFIRTFGHSGHSGLFQRLNISCLSESDSTSTPNELSPILPK